MKSAPFRKAAVAALSLFAVALASATPAPPTVAPAWKLKDVDGNTVTLAQFKGKVVVLDFWATWCPPCRADIPEYVGLQKKYAADGLVFVGVSVDTDGVGPVKKFIKEMGVTYPIVMANDDIQDAYGPFAGYPTAFIIDREGRIRNTKVGRKPLAAFEKDILAVLKPPAS
jgi:cytochrome c biogenesis protein CcmG/thiol:disulfide interchange protein DsbE